MLLLNQKYENHAKKWNGLDQEILNILEMTVLNWSSIEQWILKITLISLIKLSIVYAESKDELSISIAGGNGFMENVKGMHTPVNGNPGTTVKGLVLDDDSLNTIYSISIDHYKYLNVAELFFR